MGQKQTNGLRAKSRFVRYAPNSDHSTAGLVCPLSAISDQRTAAKSILFVHLVGEASRARAMNRAHARFFETAVPSRYQQQLILAQ